MLRLQYKARRKAVGQQEREASSEAVCRRAYPFMKALRERHARPLHLCAYFPLAMSWILPPCSLIAGSTAMPSIFRARKRLRGQ